MSRGLLGVRVIKFGRKCRRSLQGINRNRTGQLALSSVEVVLLKHYALPAMYTLCTRQEPIVTLFFPKGTIEGVGVGIGESL